MHLALQRVRTPGAREKHSMRYDAQFLVLALLQKIRSVQIQRVPWAFVSVLVLALPLPLVQAVATLFQVVPQQQGQQAQQGALTQLS